MINYVFYSYNKTFRISIIFVFYFAELDIKRSKYSGRKQYQTHLRRVSQPSTEHHIIKPLGSQLGGGSSSQSELRRNRISGSRDSSTTNKLSTTPNGTKITSFAQSVLALHKLQDSSVGYNDKSVSKRKLYFEGGRSKTGGNAYKVIIREC